jgi:hypothetical protein
MIPVNFVQNIESSMRLRRPTHPNQIGLLNGKIEHLQTWLMPSWIILVYLSRGGEKPF